MDSFETLAQAVLKMGNLANARQKDIVIDYKEDGSLVTSIDREISFHLSSLIKELFAEANVISEEELFTFDNEAPLTFVIDPIDGTDVYSQGLPSWCISVGILNQKREPIGAMINAPRWGLNWHEGLFLRQDPSKNLLLNGEPFKTRNWSIASRQITMSSYASRYLPLERYHGKIRCYGSNILHMISPLIHPLIQCAVSTPCYVWDLCGAHALLALQGLKVVYGDAKPFTYDDELLIHRKRFKGVIYSGEASAVDEIRTLFA